MEIETFDLVKILHIIAVISWFAGLFYLPRLFVYHSRVSHGSEADNIFQEMELKLLKIIMTPAMIVTFICGLYLADQIGFDGWVHAKLTLVLCLAGFQGFLSRCRKNFAAGKNKYSEKFYRIINEVPAVLLIVIVTLVILKPF